MWFILFSRAVTVENCHNSTIVLGVTKTAVNVIGCDSCSFFAVCDRVSIRFVLIPSHSSTHLAKRAQLLLWNVRESLRSENEIRVLSARGLFSSLPSLSRNLLLLIESNQSLNPVFSTCFQGKNKYYDRKNAVSRWHSWLRRPLNDFFLIFGST